MFPHRIIMTSPKAQKGNVLIISLILLAVLTLIGLSAMRSTLLEQRIAINQQDQHIAMEAAQSGLAVASKRITDISPNRPKLNDGGYYMTIGTGHPVPIGSDWSNANTYYSIPGQGEDDGFWDTDLSASNDEGLNNTIVPRYRIEDFSAPKSDLDLGTGETVESRKVRSTTFYRLTGRGEGIDNRSQAIVETVVIKELSQ